MEDIFDFPELSIASINCNSLNMSVSSKHNQIKKIYGISKLKRDIILLSDIRMCNKNLVSASSDCSKIFRTNPYCSYSFFSHSSRSKRGVGILIKNNLLFTEEARETDPDDNFLLIRGSIKGNTLIIGSVYGPNSFNPDFFLALENAIRNLGNWPVVLGGDWNCTVSNDPVINNIDCLNMNDLPNIRHTNLLRQMSSDLNLTDPFRLFYPARKDFTFCPRNPMQTNRSRIDFFMISTPLFGSISSCEIALALQNSLFDHKAIFLNINEKKIPGTCNPSISREIVNDSELEIVVKLAASECYFIHTPDNVLGLEEKNLRLLNIGRCKTAFRSLGPDPKYLPIDSLDADLLQQRDDAINNIRISLEQINFNDLENMPRSCDGDIFMEILLMAVKNDTISYQTFIKKEKDKALTELRKALANEKNGDNPNLDTIVRLESRLNLYVDSEMSREIEKYSLFEHVNMEKMTPHFLKLAKCTKPDNLLVDIKNDRGEDFESETVQREFIVGYYEKLYRLPENQKNNLAGSIEAFLGPDLLASPLIESMKISQNVSATLESDFSLPELDRAINDTKTRTAAGPDGIGNNFIKKFWWLFRDPLLKYLNCCITKGTLTDSFLTASIKLIPKKGDCSKIKNWRPISLLNCIYKIISKAVNNRLKLIVDTITSRAQKGFTQSRYIQEVLINVIHNISHCDHNNVPAFVLSLDQRKAFDSVRHDFMMEVYKFWGIGNNFSNVLKLITTGRNATIKFDNGSLSRKINLETGAPQGNSPSPLQYNFCEQIAILKLELDPRVASIYNHHLVPRPPPLGGGLDNRQRADGGPGPEPVPEEAPVPDPVQRFPLFEILPGVANVRQNIGQAINLVPDPFRMESNRETDKVESFADDKTVTFLATEEGLIAVCEILRDFEAISGLACNMDKSAIMLVGSNDPPPEFLNTYDFQLVDKIKILGLEITDVPLDRSLCHTKTIDKIVRIVNFWDRFHLSLPGRITIAKTLILSQISYLGSIIPLNPDQLKETKKIIEKFINGKLNIAKTRIYNPVELGGLGMIDLAEFLTAQQVSWIKRASSSSRDTWRVDLKKIGKGEILTVSPNEVQPEIYPLFKHLTVSYETFLKAFNRINENFYKAKLINNPLLKRGRNDNRKINWSFFSNNNPRLEAQTLNNVKIGDIAGDGRLFSLDVIVANTGLEINLATYLRLQEAFFVSRNLFNGGPTTGSSTGSATVSEFFNRFKKGSKQIRKCISSERISKIKVDELTCVRTMEALTNVFGVPTEAKKNCLGFWGNSFLPMDLREFSFKFFNNSLGTNQRIGNFIEGRGQGCTFCTVANNGPILVEKFMHLFFDCPIVADIMGWFQNQFLGDINFTSREEKIKFWIFGILPPNENLGEQYNTLSLLIAQQFQFIIWRFKLLKRLPVRVAFEMDFFYSLKKIRKMSSVIENQMQNSDLLLCRNWGNLIHRRG